MIVFPALILAIEDESDRSFMEWLYVEHSYMMFRSAYSITGNAQAAEDVVSEACVALIRCLRTVRSLGRDKLRAYVLATVQNKARDYLRWRKKQVQCCCFTEKEDALPAVDGDVDDALICEAEQATLRRALAKLSDRDRELLRMKYFEQYSNEEIAQQFGLKHTVICYYLRRARQKLKQLLLEVEAHG